MAPSFQRQWIKRCVDVLTRPWTRSPRKHRRDTWRPSVEHLENRLAPAAISWTGNAGTLNWGDMNNWSSNAVPSSSDDVTISKSGVGTIVVGASSYAVRSLNDTTAALTIASGGSLALAAVPVTSTFGQNVTVQSGATLTVGAGANVALGGTNTLADNGTLTFASGDTVTLIASGSGATQIVVGNGGVLTASSTAFSSNVSGYGYVIVNGGGHLTASNSTFASSLNQVNLNSGSILNAGDLTGNSFNCPLYLPEADVQYLSGSGSNNAQFQAIDILSGTEASGQTLALNAIGTASTANLVYVFTGNFTVASGATMNVGANVSVQVGGTNGTSLSHQAASAHESPFFVQFFRVWHTSSCIEVR
jgi:hypothetical protein